MPSTLSGNLLYEMSIIFTSLFTKKEAVSTEDTRLSRIMQPIVDKARIASLVVNVPTLLILLCTIFNSAYISF